MLKRHTAKSVCCCSIFYSVEEHNTTWNFSVEVFVQIYIGRLIESYMVQNFKWWCRFMFNNMEIYLRDNKYLVISEKKRIAITYNSTNQRKPLSLIIYIFFDKVASYNSLFKLWTYFLKIWTLISLVINSANIFPGPILGPQDTVLEKTNTIPALTVYEVRKTLQSLVVTRFWILK